MGSYPTSTWETKAAEKRAQLASLIPSPLKLKALPPAETLNVTKWPLESVLSARDLEITESGDVGLVLGKMASGEWTALEVTTAYCNRAIAAHQLVNCLTELFVDRAIARAKELDAYYAEHGKTIGPLHGLPISLKDQIDVKDIEMTMGFVGWSGRGVSEKDAVLVDLMLKQGVSRFASYADHYQPAHAVPRKCTIYCRTNVPQALMFGEAYNNLFGRTSNPYNRALTCGGSSGGEGALIGLKGSLMGIGSDLGGSIRIPCAFQGLYGLRPSYNRIPYQGTTNSMEGQEAVPSVLGPMTSSIDGLKIFTKAIADSKPWEKDPIALRRPWDESEYKLASHGGEGGKLCFAIMWDDGVAKVHPPYKRAMQETKAALLAAGHEVIDWEPLDHAEGLDIILRIYDADGGKDIQLACELSGEPRLGWVVSGEGENLPTYDYWQLCREKLAHIKKQLDHWEATVTRTSTGRPVDAIITPTSAHCPPPHDAAGYIYYTAFCNLADYAATTYPVTFVDPAIDAKEPAHEFRNKYDERVYNIYDNPEKFRDAPISLQCIARKNEEEAVIRMTEIIDAALKKAKK